MSLRDMIFGMIVLRTTPGPCLFCRREAVTFTREHLPPESVAGAAAVELLGWVCAGCNNGFSSDEVYFASHYHGAEAGVLQQVTAKRWRGARVQRADLNARYHVRSNTATMRLKRPLKPGQALPEFRATGIGSMDIEPRMIDAQRLSRCLAKMALETLAWQKPGDALEDRFDAVRDYARGGSQLAFLPYALGASRDRLGARLWEIQLNGQTGWVAGALITLPGASYAVQLCDLDDLSRLWNFARLNGMIFDDAGTRTGRVRFSLNMQRPSTSSPERPS